MSVNSFVLSTDPERRRHQVTWRTAQAQIDTQREIQSTAEAAYREIILSQVGRQRIVSGHDHHDQRSIRKVASFRSECPHCDWLSQLCASEHVADASLDEHIELNHIVDLEPDRWEKCGSDCPDKGRWGASVSPLASGWSRQYRWKWLPGNSLNGGYVVHEKESSA